MRPRILQFGNALLVAVALGIGVVAALSRPGDVWAQTTGTVTCWAESCSGNVCVRVKIECPVPIKPVDPE
jgi:hypothetical protein